VSAHPPRLRPTFVVPLRPERDEAIELIRTGLAESVPASRWIGKGRWAEIHVPGEDQRIWSPYLSVRLDAPDDETPEGAGCTLFARFAPRPEIWTGFVFAYAAVAFLALIGGIFGYVQWASDESPWGLWAIAVGVPLLALLHLFSWLGQRWSHDQMVELKAILDPVIEPIRSDQG